MLFQRGSMGPMGNQFDQMAASVAPPKLTTDAAGKAVRTSSGSVRGIQSPLSNTRRRDDDRPEVDRYGTSWLSVAGAEFQIVICPAINTFASREGWRSSSSPAMTTVAPAPRAPNTS